MTISTGDKLPDAKFKVPTADGPAEMTTAEVFGGKTVALFGVPGAFTPTCSMNHLPGYLQHFDELKAKGVDTIAVVAVNDVFVMKAWQESANAAGKILFLADGSADFTKAAGLELDLTAGGLGLRCKRFSMVVKDGVVKSLNLEDSPGTAEKTGAEALLGQL